MTGRNKDKLTIVGMFGLFIILVALAATIMVGCAALPHVQATDEDGNPQYYATDESGTTYKTSEKVDPKTGVERDPVMVVDTNKVEKGGQSAINTVSSLVPAPYGTYVSIGGNAILALALIALKLYNKRKLAKLEQETDAAVGIAAEIARSIENAKDVKNPDIVDMTKVTQSKATEEFVAEAVKGM